MSVHASAEVGVGDDGHGAQRSDTTPPVTVIYLRGQEGDQDWFKSDVTVFLSATDEESGIADIFCKIGDRANIAPCWGSFTMTEEGVHRVDFFAKDKAGNIEGVQTVQVKIDKTPPAITLELDEEQYTRVETIVPTWDATDAVSGMCFTTTWISAIDDAMASAGPLPNHRAVELFWMTPRPHEFAVRARDCAGWEAVATAPFEVTPSLDSVRETVAELATRGDISEAAAHRLTTQIVYAEQFDNQQAYRQAVTVLNQILSDPNSGLASPGISPRAQNILALDTTALIDQFEQALAQPAEEDAPAEPTLALLALGDSFPPANGTIRIIESDDERVRATGSWAAQFAPEASGMAYLYSSGSSSDSLRFDFTGKRVDVIFTQHGDASEFAIELNGARIGTVESTVEDGAFGLRASITGLAASHHTLRIVPLRGNVAIDGFAVEARYVQ